MEVVMLKKLIFISVLTIVLLGWSLPVMADESAADNQKAEPTTENALTPTTALQPVKNATPTGPALLLSKPSKVVERPPVEPIHNPAGSQMFVAGLTIPVTCDGSIDATEWSDAYMYDVSDTSGQEDGIPDPLGTVILWLKQDDNGVYFAIRNNADAVLDEYDQCGLYFDDNHDGCWPASATNEGNNWLVYSAAGSFVAWRWWQDYDCGYPPNYVCVYNNVLYPYNWSPPCFGIGIGPTGVVDYEVMIPYGATDEHLDLTMPPDSLGFFMYCMNQGTGDFHGEWPSQGYLNTYNEPCYYGHLICETGEDSLYWKPDYEDYAPSGMPDIDQKQDSWYKYELGEFSFCGPVAVANCFKWFDSKYNVPPGTPCDARDQFPLVRDYTDALPALWCAMPWDDHSPENMDHLNTPWLFGATPPPPPTAQPFVPGPQPAPSGMPPWGELVERLAWYFNTDGVQSGYCEFSGTKVSDMQAGIDAWFESEMFEDSSTIADTLYERTWRKPTFAWVETLVEKCQDVILLLGFWFEDPPGSGAWFRCGGHYVTVAGINSEEFLIAFSDPYFDNAERGGPGRVRNGIIIPHAGHPFGPMTHNDEGNVSHDIYSVTTQAISPGGLWELIDYPVSLNPYDCERFHQQNVPPEFEPVSEWWNGYSPVFTEVEYAIEISPWEYPPFCGDCNGDGAVNIADVVCMVNYLFIPGSPPPVSMVKSDVNHDGSVNIADVVYMLNYLFLNGSLPQCYDP
jgi:hypothetical protein